MALNFSAAYTPPGINTLREAVDATIFWNRFELQVCVPGLISGAARDSGNDTTTVLRAGLVLGQITSSSKLTQWSTTATDGSQNVYGILAHDINTQMLGADQDRYVGWVLVSGYVKAGRTLIGGQSSEGISGVATEHILRAQCAGRITFDDSFVTYGGAVGLGSFRDIVAKTANYTVTEADNHTLFTNKGDADAINFTLPTTAEKGLHYGFFAVANFSLTVTAGTADTMVVFNDAAADSVAYGTANEIIGGFFEVLGDGALWYVFPRLGADSQTITVVTA